MRKDDIRYSLMAEERAPKYYAENDDRKTLFLELLNERFPYAIRLFCSAPAVFDDKWNEYKTQHLEKIWPLYTEKKSDEQKRQYYIAQFKDSSNLNDSRNIIENDIWKCSTIDLLRIFSKAHKDLKSNKSNNNGVIEFHEDCISKLKKVIQQADEEMKKAKEYAESRELARLKSLLLSDIVNDELIAVANTLLEKHAKIVYSPNGIKEICTNYKSQKWLDIYIKGLLDNAKIVDMQAATLQILNSSVAKKIDDGTMTEFLKKNDTNESVEFFEQINPRDTFDRMFKLYTQSYNRPNVILDLTRMYFNKFPDSGEAIENATTYVLEGRASVNALPVIIEEHSKKWLLSINLHNRTDEICSVIEALNSVGKLRDLFFDFSFWKKMDRSNAFLNVVDGISFIVGFEECFDLIKKNYLAAHIFEEDSLERKWIMAANSIAVHYEEAQKPYVMFISDLLDNDGLLDARSQQILTKETIFNLVQQAANNKKLYNLEVEKNRGIKTELIRDVIFHVCSPLEKLEKALISYSIKPDDSREMLKAVRNHVAKVRDALDKVGIQTLVNSTDWEKVKTVPFDPIRHKCSENVKSGEEVLCLSMGMKDLNEGFMEKANVKPKNGEKSNGSNI